MKINENVVFIIVLLVALVWAIFFFPKPAGAQTVVIVPDQYSQCVDTCLAYNGYNTDTYNYCQVACMNPDAVVIGPNGVGVYINGGYYPHYIFPHFRHHDEPRHNEPRHDHDRNGHDHHGRR